MNETKIIIDAGHGGRDPGASGNGIIEKNLNLEISKYMYNRFKQLGIPVKMTRDSDITLSPIERTDKILNAYGNDPNVIVISNHVNAGGGEGAEIIYALRNNSILSDLILENLKQSGQLIREAYQRRLPSNPAKDYYFIQRDTGKTQSIIVEYGFLDTILDANRLKTNYKSYAEAVVKSVVEYLDLSYDKEDNKNIYTVQKGD
ncbi:MAG: N-acetylmuramoyl-L-alanine amidase, partial [Bacilli bacterium]